jgi:multiple sugar transport system permease protein
MMRSLKTLRSESIWWIPAAALMTVFVAYPILRTSGLSLFHQNLDTQFQPRFAGIDNYLRILGDARLHGAAMTTVLFTAISVAAEFCIGLALALATDTLLRRRGLIRVLLLIPWTLPTAVIAVLWTWIFNDQYGLLNALLQQIGIVNAPIAWLAGPTTALASIIVADVWKTTPFVFVILLAGAQNIPSELYEAIEIDGGGAWERFRYITWPHLLPFVFVAVIFRMVQAFAIFDLVWVMTGGGPAGATETVSVYVYQTYLRYLDFGYGSAVVVAAVGLLAIAAGGLYRLLMKRYERVF